MVSKATSGNKAMKLNFKAGVSVPTAGIPGDLKVVLDQLTFFFFVFRMFFDGLFCFSKGDVSKDITPIFVQ